MSFADDPTIALSEYRRLYEEHWRVAQSARSLAAHSEQPDAHERARDLRGEVARLLPQVERHLRAVGIEVTEVSGGVRPAAVDRVIALAIERHRERQAFESQTAQPSDAPYSRSRPSPRALFASLVLLSAGGVGWGLVVAGWV